MPSDPGTIRGAAPSPSSDRSASPIPVGRETCDRSLRVVDGSGASFGDPDDPILIIASALCSGAIVALKGLGGFHLSCRARDAAAVRTLRERKRRPAKPFAIMVPDLEAARSLVHLEADEEALLVGRERPILLARRRGGEYDVAWEVAPGQPTLGVMLPYTLQHNLLLSEVGEPLVMTSGNLSSEPVCYRNDDALARLGGIADLFLLHDRPIEEPIDDSVARIVAVGGDRTVQLIRRARGFAPLPLELPVPAERPILACGAEMKATVTLSVGGRAWLSQHLGDLDDYETLAQHAAASRRLEELAGVAPEVVVHDLHPDFASTRYAMERAELLGAERIAVQHHHAHLAAVLAEHGEKGPTLGVIFDGTGYGPDGTVWGGEFLVGDLLSFERVGHLKPVRMPGGEAAVREPWRMACAWLAAAGDVVDSVPPIPANLAGWVDPARWRAVAQLAATGLASPITTSMGRLFDAVGAICGLGARASYEGEAAIALEGVVERGEGGWYEVELIDGRPLVLDPRPMIRALVADLERGARIGVVASRFHNSLIRAAVAASLKLAAIHGVESVVLSGGVFQNRELLEGAAAELVRAGLRVLAPGEVPPNDGGISFGQAAIAAARVAAAWTGVEGRTAEGAAAGRGEGP